MALAILVLLLTLTGGATWLLNRDDPQTLDVPLRMQDPDTVFCGPASLGMAFDFLSRQPSANSNQLPTNQDIINFMKSKNLLYDFGTGVEELAYAARLQGYDGSYYFSDWDITRLKQELHEGRPVLTPIKLDNYKQPVGHFLTVTGFSPDEGFVIANDPLKGEVHIPVDEFNQAWQANGARGVVVAPKPVPTIPDSTLPLFAGVGAAAALAGLAALGTARKGLGAGRTDEGEGTWANYSWYEPPAPARDTWWDEPPPPAYSPPDTWFDSRVYDEGPHEYTPPSFPPPQDGNTYSYVNQHSGDYTPPPPPEASDKGARDDAAGSYTPPPTDGNTYSYTNQHSGQYTLPPSDPRLYDEGPREQSEEEKQKLATALQKQREEAEQRLREEQAIREEEAKQRAMEAAQKLAQEEADRAAAAALLTSARDNYNADKNFNADKTRANDSWWDKTKKFLSDPVGVLQQTLIAAGQNDLAVKNLLAGVSQAWGLYDTNVNQNSIVNAVRDFGAGISVELLKNNIDSLALITSLIFPYRPAHDAYIRAEQNIENQLPNTVTFTAGQLVGDLAGIAQGIAEIVSGAGIAGGGSVGSCLASLFTLCPEGVAVSVVGGVAVAAHGLTVMGVSATNAGKQIASLMSNGQGDSGGPGKWNDADESMSNAARDYQEQITGRRGEVYKVKGVKFDGFDDARQVLLDAKDDYRNFVDSNDKFYSWFDGADDLVDEARRQIKAAGKYDIEWHVADENVANAIRDLLADQGLTKIEVIHTPNLSR